jgi:hypothetical protein
LSRFDDNFRLSNKAGTSRNMGRIGLGPFTIYSLPWIPNDRV